MNHTANLQEFSSKVSNCWCSHMAPVTFAKDLDVKKKHLLKTWIGYKVEQSLLPGSTLHPCQGERERETDILSSKINWSLWAWFTKHTNFLEVVAIATSRLLPPLMNTGRKPIKKLAYICFKRRAGGMWTRSRKALYPAKLIPWYASVVYKITAPPGIPLIVENLKISYQRWMHVI